MQNVYSPGLAWAAPTMLGLPMVIVIMVFGGDVGEDGAHKGLSAIVIIWMTSQPPPGPPRQQSSSFCSPPSAGDKYQVWRKRGEGREIVGEDGGRLGRRDWSSECWQLVKEMLEEVLAAWEEEVLPGWKQRERRCWQLPAVAIN